MSEAEQSLSPSVLHRVFYGPSELRAGWRLLIFLAIVIALINVSNLMVRRVLHGADNTTFFLVREVMDFLIFLLASGIMGRIEGRTIADYGLPWRRMFRVQYWQGVLLGFASITGLLVAMRAAGVFYFGSIALHGPNIWKWAIVYAFVFILVALREEFRARGYGLFTLSAGIGFWSAAILSAAFLATLIMATPERIGSDCLTPGRLDCWPVSCCVEPAISGCQSGFTWPSTGARRTFMVSPTVAKRCPVIF